MVISRTSLVTTVLIIPIMIVSECLTFGQFEEQSLESTVFNLLNYVRALELKLEGYEKRLVDLEGCDCFRSCRVNGSLFADGSHWREGCNIAYCVAGQVIRKPVQCPKLPCKNPVKEDGLCCPVCKKQCLLNGRVLEHNQRIKKHCLTCTCNDGSVKCRHEDPNSCPPLNCPEAKQFSKDDECCRFCEGEDFCARGHNCDKNARCKNLKTGTMCECNKGFWGDGTPGQCTDIDECRKKSGQDAHNCQSNSKCINTPGSYKCECLPGFIHINSTLCIDIDECESNQHDCSEGYICVNTPGSFKCQCLQLDGKSCCDDPSACAGLQPESSLESNDSESHFNSVEKQQLEEEKEEEDRGDEEQNRGEQSNGSGSGIQDQGVENTDDEDMK